jgi:hypothetical protein
LTCWETGHLERGSLSDLTDEKVVFVLAEGRSEQQFNCEDMSFSIASGNDPCVSEYWAWFKLSFALSKKREEETFLFFFSLTKSKSRKKTKIEKLSFLLFQKHWKVLVVAVNKLKYLCLIGFISSFIFDFLFLGEKGIFLLFESSQDWRIPLFERRVGFEEQVKD